MCGGICGPTGEKVDWNSRYYRRAVKKIKQRKVPYNNHSGKVLASWEGQRMFVEMYKSKYNGEYVVSWSSVSSSGAATYKYKRNAISEYNKHVPKERRIL